ncbi:MAG: tRNA (adenosine(37)-N6)-threonylcarbamoyltransferase complex dimerization subunit type 1 TsaB [Spirochaetaceae bacterium]
MGERREPTAAGYLMAVDTSSELLGVGLLPRYSEGDKPITDTESDKIATIEVDAGLHHVERVMPAVEELLTVHEVNVTDLLGLLAARGPGSFTGLRIGVSLLKGISAVTGAPILLVPTLEAFAEPFAREEGLLLSALDARKGRFYVQFYRRGTYLTPALDLTVPETAERASSLLEPGEPIILVGPDSGKLREQIGLSCTLPALRRRSAVRGLLIAGDRRLRAGERLPDEGGPLYLRGSEAVFPRRRRE